MKKCYPKLFRSKSNGKFLGRQIRGCLWPAFFSFCEFFFSMFIIFWTSKISFRSKIEKFVLKWNFWPHHFKDSVIVRGMAMLSCPLKIKFETDRRFSWIIFKNSRKWIIFVLLCFHCTLAYLQSQKVQIFRLISLCRSNAKLDNRALCQAANCPSPSTDSFNG